METNPGGHIETFPFADGAYIQEGDVIKLRNVAEDVVGIEILRGRKTLFWLDPQDNQRLQEIEVDFSVIQPPARKPQGFAAQALSTAILVVRHNPALALESVETEDEHFHFYRVRRSTARAGDPSESTGSGKHNSS